MRALNTASPDMRAIQSSFFVVIENLSGGGSTDWAPEARKVIREVSVSSSSFPPAGHRIDGSRSREVAPYAYRILLDVTSGWSGCGEK